MFSVAGAEETKSLPGAKQQHSISYDTGGKGQAQRQPHLVRQRTGLRRTGGIERHCEGNRKNICDTGEIPGYVKPGVNRRGK